jgi:hypothetical protein
VKESFVGFAHAGVVITGQFVSGYVQLCWDGELFNRDFLVLVSQDVKEGCFGEVLVPVVGRYDDVGIVGEYSSGVNAVLLVLFAPEDVSFVVAVGAPILLGALLECLCRVSYLPE